MYDDKYHFITFTLFSGFLSGFRFETIIPKPDPIRISGLVFRSKPDPLVKDHIRFLGFRVPFTVLGRTHQQSGDPGLRVGKIQAAELALTEGNCRGSSARGSDKRSPYVNVCVFEWRCDLSTEYQTETLRGEIPATESAE